PELLDGQVDDLFGLYAVRGELSADERQQAGDAIALRVIDNLVAARQVVGIDAPLESGIAHARPRPQWPPLLRLRDGTCGSLDDVVYLLSIDAEIHERGIAVVIDVVRADDGLCAVRYEEHRAAVHAFEDHPVIADPPLERDVD